MKVEKITNALFSIEIECSECKKISQYNLLKGIYLPPKIKTSCLSCGKVLVEDLPMELLDINTDLNGVIYIKEAK